MALPDFQSILNAAGGPARPTRFDVEIVPPNIFTQASNQLPASQTNAIVAQASANGTTTQSLGLPVNYFQKFGLTGLNIQERLNFLCKRAELPGKSFNTSDQRTYGSFFKIPNVDSYTDITLTFIVGEKMQEKSFFDAWSYTIQDPETSDFNYVNDYASTVDIYQLDQQDNYTYGCRLYQCWPISMGQLTFDYDARNEYQVLPVTFTYRKWINLAINSQTPTSVSSPSGSGVPFATTIQPSSGPLK